MTQTRKNRKNTKNTKNKTANNKTTNNKSKKRVFTRKDYNSGDGMLTASWGPAIWHYLHMMSFNYPVEPTPENKKQYREFIINLQQSR